MGNRPSICTKPIRSEYNIPQISFPLQRRAHARRCRMPLPTIFLAFANQPDHPLPTLQEEDDAVYRLLAAREKEQHFNLHRDSYTTLDKLTSFLTLYREEVVLFSYSGHAGRSALLLEDGTAHARGLAQMLGQCPELRVVLLNGCSTQGQVDDLLANGVPVVIATSAPVGDRSATFFAQRFYEGLNQQQTLGEAFRMAKAAVETAFGDKILVEYRDTALAAPDARPKPAWGLFYGSAHAHILDWKLPTQSVHATVEAGNFVPNQQLVEVLFAALAEFSPDIERLQKQAQRGMSVPMPKKRMAVLNALPAPLAEPLRKLLVPIEMENEGYDKVSLARLRQVGEAFHISVELLCFTLMAQLWEAWYEQGGLQLLPEQQVEMRKFFKLTRVEREVFDMVAFIGEVRSILDANNIRYFVKELRDIRDLLDSDARFAEALQFLNSLRLQVRRPNLGPADIALLCQRGEDDLAYLYGKLGFLARYKLATIQGIDVLKYRHQRSPRFNHSAVILHDLLGGFDVSSVDLDRSMDNRSILLIDEETWGYLNLSPFVMDENAFEERADVCKLYFFSHYLPAADTCFFRYVNKPDDPFVEASAEKFTLLKDQLEAFSALMFQQKLSAL